MVLFYLVFATSIAVDGVAIDVDVVAVVDGVAFADVGKVLVCLVVVTSVALFPSLSGHVRIAHCQRHCFVDETGDWERCRARQAWCMHVRWWWLEPVHDSCRTAPPAGDSHTPLPPLHADSFGSELHDEVCPTRSRRCWDREGEARVAGTEGTIAGTPEPSEV